MKEKSWYVISEYKINYSKYIVFKGKYKLVNTSFKIHFTFVSM